eukprot:COSAG02_NODE_1447_length_12575_cov_8.479400_8_plen_71_part_00
MLVARCRRAADTIRSGDMGNQSKSGRRAQLAPTVPMWRVDEADRQEAPRGTEQRLGQLQMGRLQPASVLA